ncbi:MAG: thiamine diphosphokinase [bacterium]|nr:thiamine diphosphokinase [bacterium]
MDRRAVIVGGGTLSPEVLRELDPSDYLVGVDYGAYWLVNNGKVPHVAIGDFDSVTQEELARIKESIPRVLIHAPEKNYTDMELAVEHTLEQNPSNIVIYGAFGSRWDHSIGNLYLLKRAMEKNIPAVIRNEQNEAFLLAGALSISPSSRFRYISILPFTPTIVVTLAGCTYNVKQKKITQGETIGISNEVTQGGGIITIHEGVAVVFRSRDAEGGNPTWAD